MPRPHPRAATRHKWAGWSFLLVVLAVGCALALSLSLRPLIALNPFLLFFGAIAVSARYGGLRPALAAALLSAVAAGAFLVSPEGVFALGPLDLARLTGFTLIGLLIGVLIAEHQQVLGALRASELRHRKTLAGVGDAVLTTDARGRVTFLNAAAEALTGWPAETANGQESSAVLRLVNDGTRHPADRLIERVLNDGAELRLVDQVVLIARDGTERAIEYSGTPIHADDGSVLGAALILRDVGARRQLERHAISDTVTGLANRALFLSSVQQALARTRRRSEYGFALLVLDLDRFKTVNDSLGPQAGDQLLIVTGQRISACLRSTDTVARLSGDEFAILLDDCVESSSAVRVADHIQQQLMAPLEISEHELVVTATIGITLSSTGYEQPEAMLRDASIALSRARAEQARHALFDTAMHAHTRTLLQREAELRRALQRDEFCLHYQPIVALSSGMIIGVEALIRWQHPERGLVSPIEFIPLAEDTGLIVPLGEWIVRSACQQAKAWQDAGVAPLSVTVNLSARQFKQNDMPTLLERLLRDTGCPPQAIHLELTETSVMEDAETTIKTLEALRSLGVGLSIDDFGTGYSSLRYLQRFPISTLKIDRSFVHNSTNDMQSAAIITAMIALAHRLNLNVIAEGVETLDQHAFLQQEQCDAFQGYICSRPIPATQVPPLLLTGPCVPPRAIAAGASPLAPETTTGRR